MKKPPLFIVVVGYLEVVGWMRWDDDVWVWNGVFSFVCVWELTIVVCVAMVMWKKIDWVTNNAPLMHKCVVIFGIQVMKVILFWWTSVSTSLLWFWFQVVDLFLLYYYSSANDNFVSCLALQVLLSIFNFSC